MSGQPVGPGEDLPVIRWGEPRKPRPKRPAADCPDCQQLGRACPERHGRRVRLFKDDSAPRPIDELRGNWRPV